VAKKEIAMHRWLIVLFLIMLALLPASAVAAIEVAGVLLPERVRLSPDSPPLGLNGAGVHRRYLFIELYVAALYLAEPKRKADTLLAADDPQRLLLHFLRDVSPERTHRLWEKIGANGSDFEQLRARRDRFESVFNQGLKKGDEIAFDYLPGAGTYVRLNGQTKTVIPGEDFYDALLRIWLGEKPASRKLKRALLGSIG
jgi:hypothetical protein